MDQNPPLDKIDKKMLRVAIVSIVRNEDEKENKKVA